MWWHRNFFAEIFPSLAAFMTTTLCHVWVMATGAVTTVAGMADVYALVTGRHRRRDRRAAL